MWLPQYADKKNMIFEKDGKIIRYNSKIQKLLFKIEKMPNFKATYTMIYDHLQKIEEYLKIKGVYNEKRQLRYLDISKTHEAYFIKCPNCGMEYENISSNWALAKVDFSNDYYLVCAKCKGGPSNEYIKD